ncbi:hypothetical protein TNIN_342321 [Trichonephila inaurata madagascariensis]|uniref:Uncharacterized protein n=1 Tax=Trichonephila inaurata madagascariensis TaxID=2747483 RepID=A0A8X6WMJ4_9ARAC|nr:hypothetical protein TNIN_342321 [Trichonephila inaurata madagascariensis]
MIRAGVCASLFPKNNAFNLTTTSGNATASAQQMSCDRPPLISRETIQAVVQCFTPFCSSDSLQHLARPFGALTCTLRLRTGPIDAGHSDIHQIPLRDTESKKSCQRATAEAPSAEVAYTKSLLFSGCVR